MTSVHIRDRRGEDTKTRRRRPGEDTGLDTLRDARIFSDVRHRKVRTTQHPAAIIVVAFPSPEMTTLLTFFCVFPASLSHVDICHCNILLMGFLKAQRVC